ncbi:hypothetical protein MTO96_021875 [Rhipicephalus appendiculatus]
MCSDVCVRAVIGVSSPTAQGGLRSKTAASCANSQFESTAPAFGQLIPAPGMSTASEKQRSAAHRQDTKTARMKQPRQQSEPSPRYRRRRGRRSSSEVWQPGLTKTARKRPSSS